MAMRRGDREWATTSLRETAQVLSFEGRTWAMVRPGVICTKGINQFVPAPADAGLRIQRPAGPAAITA